MRVFRVYWGMDEKDSQIKYTLESILGIRDESRGDLLGGTGKGPKCRQSWKERLLNAWPYISIFT